MARKLINRRDILSDLVDIVLPKYFPENTLDKNRNSILGYITEAMAVSMEDTITLEQRRAADYCPELSTSEIHVRQTAKIRAIEVDYAKPGRCFAIIGVLKSDILTKGESLSNHPIAKSILKLKKGKIDNSDVLDYKEIEGNGISFKLNKKNVLIGNSKLCGCDIDTDLHLSINGKHVASVVINDGIKENAKETISKLKNSNIKTYMFTGDKKAVALNIGKK